MKKNRLAIIITSLLIIIAVVLLWNNRYLTSLRGEAYDFTVRDTASVTRLFFADMSGNQVLLERTEEGWKVNGKDKLETGIFQPSQTGKPKQDRQCRIVCCSAGIWRVQLLAVAADGAAVH